MERILISGATGAIGKPLLRALASELSNIEIVCLYNQHPPSPEGLEDAAARGVVIRALPCDLTSEDSVKSCGDRLGVVDSCLAVHCAADVSWSKTLDEVTPLNVTGTVNFFEMLRRTSKRAGAIYLSSAYTSVSDWNYRNSYEESKAMAEREIKARFPEIPVSVFSSSLVIGDTRTGEISRFHGIYPIIKFAALFEVPFFVGKKDCRIDLIPLDWTVEQLMAMVRRRLDGGPCDNVVACGSQFRITLSELGQLIYRDINRYRESMGCAPKDVPPILSYRQWQFIRRSVQKWDIKKLPPRKFKYFEGLMESYKHYIADDTVLPPKNLTRDAPDPRSYFHKVSDYWFRENIDYVSNRWKKETTART